MSTAVTAAHERHGLTGAEVAAGLRRDGPNVLPAPRPAPPVLLLARQMTRFFALLLWTAAVLAYLGGMPQLALAIVIVVLVNGAFAFVQEYRADRAGARSGRLRASELSDATITVTNLGDRGVESVFGVIHPPQVALVGLGKITERPVAADGLIGVRPVVVTTLAADHRASDGYTGGRYLIALSDRLQHPEELQ